MPVSIRSAWWLGFGVALGLAVLTACGSDSDDGGRAVGPPGDAAAAVAPTAVPTTAALNVPTAGPDPASGQSAAPTPLPLTTAGEAGRIFLPRLPESGDDFTLAFPVERGLAPVPLPSEEGVRLLVELWLAGPTSAEADAGYLEPLPVFERAAGCATDFDIELTDGEAVVTLCGLTSSAGIGEDARALSSLERTLVASGHATRVALLEHGGEHCYGTLGGGADPCRSGPAPCPVDLAAAEAAVVGVEEWVRMRAKPSLDAEELDKLDAGAVVTAFPDSLRYDGRGLWWVTVRHPDDGYCGSVAAMFLADGEGRLDRPLPGVSFTLPASTTWHHSVLSDPRAHTHTWSLDGAPLTSLLLAVSPGRTIDERLASELAFFEENGYDYPADWYRELDVVGADRAVALVYTISASGDIGTETVVIELGEHTITAESAVYVEDVHVAPVDEMAAFLASIEVDPATFLAGAGG